MNSTGTIFARLAPVAPSLAVWNGAPAIFSEAAPDEFLNPKDASGNPIDKPTKPYLIIAVPTSDVALETFTETGRLIAQDVRGYQRHSGSGAALDALMRTVRDLFHNRPVELVVTGGVCEVCRVTGPVASPTSDEAYIGRRITIRLDLKNT